MASTDYDRAERAAVYQLLARLWAEEPGLVLERLRTEPLRSAWEHLGGVVPDQDSADAHTLLDEDYCRLFIGPKGHLPPIQSVWESGELDTGVTASLREFDTVIGFEEPWNFTIVPDHLGNELWVMSQILRKSARLAADDQTVANDLASQFFKGHLNWTDEFLEAVIDRESDQFYGTVASVTQRFLRDEAACLEVPALKQQLQSRNV